MPKSFKDNLRKVAMQIFTPGRAILEKKREQEIKKEKELQDKLAKVRKQTEDEFWGKYGVKNADEYAAILNAKTNSAIQKKARETIKRFVEKSRAEDMPEEEIKKALLQFPILPETDIMAVYNKLVAPVIESGNNLANKIDKSFSRLNKQVTRS